MKLLPSKPVQYALLIIALLLGFWGYCFERAYFGRLGLNVHKIFGASHFVASSAKSIVPMLIAIAIYANVKRFFTKGIHTDPGQDIVAELNAAPFNKQISIARFGAAMSIVFLVLVIGLPAIGVTLQIWHTYLYMVFIVLQSFVGATLTSPPHARATVILTFAISVGACFAGGGYGYALAGQGKIAEVVRDDLVVKVNAGPDGAFTAEPKLLTIPFPASIKFLGKVLEP